MPRLEWSDPRSPDYQEYLRVRQKYRQIVQGPRASYPPRC